MLEQLNTDKFFETYSDCERQQACYTGPRPSTLAKSSSPPRPFAALTTQPCPLPAPRLYLGRHQRQHSSSSGSELSELWLRLIRLCLKACDASALASFFSRPWPPPRRSSYASPSPPLCPSCALSSQPWHLFGSSFSAASRAPLTRSFSAASRALSRPCRRPTPSARAPASAPARIPPPAAAPARSTQHRRPAAGHQNC